MIQETFVVWTQTAKGGRVLNAVADSYLEEKVIQDYPSMSAMLFDDWGLLKESVMKRRDGEGVNSLGGAYWGRKIGNLKVQRQQAVECFRFLFTVYTREAVPQEWAITQNNLGVALSNQAAEQEGVERTRLLRAAAEAYRLALQVYTQEVAPLDWAGIQNNLGCVLIR